MHASWRNVTTPLLPSAGGGGRGGGGVYKKNLNREPYLDNSQDFIGYRPSRMCTLYTVKVSNAIRKGSLGYMQTVKMQISEISQRNQYQIV